MIQQMFEKNILLYVIAGLCGFGIILKILIGFVYHGLIKASDQMGNSNNKLMKLMRLKFEACYKLQIGVNNIDTFVEKYIYKYKFCGISLYTWENLGKQLIILCMTFGIAGTILAIMYEYPRNIVFLTLLTGIVASAFLLFFENLFNFKFKKNIIKINAKDYLENFFKSRLEKEYFILKEDTITAEEKNTLEEKKKNTTVKQDKPFEEEEDIKMLKDSLFSHSSVKETAAAKRSEKYKKNNKEEHKTSELMNKVQPERQRQTKKEKKNYEMSEKEEKIIEDILKEYLA